MSGINRYKEYNENTVQPGNKGSKGMKTHCDEANQKYSLASELGILGKNGKIIVGGDTGITAVEIPTDGAGTKIDIYTNQFDCMIVENIAELRIFSEQFFVAYDRNVTFEDIEGQAEFSELINVGIELLERALLEVVAMCVDDLLDGQTAMAINDLIDINRLSGIDTEIFVGCMKKAMANVIKETRIAITAGETARMGSGKIANLLVQSERSMEEELRIIISQVNRIIDTKGFNHEVKEQLRRINSKISYASRHQRDRREVIVNERIAMNIGGTCLGVSGDKNKLVDLEDGFDVFGLFENPTKAGIIGGRANGYTLIRESVDELVGAGWENISFEHFMEKIGREKAGRIPEDLIQECTGLKMGDIATGRTTVFNPFVSTKLLGGIKNDCEFKIASMAHITGGPKEKFMNLLKGKEDEFRFEINMEGLVIPQIIRLLQYINQVEDTDAIKGFNMGVPCAGVCSPSDTDDIIERARENGMDLRKIGKIYKKDVNVDPRLNMNVIHGVGVGKSSIEF